MIIQSVPLSHLVSSDQPRPLLTAEVDKLASSIKEIGLIQPITVTPAAVQHGIVEQGWRIVAGHHRVAAVRALGWKEIDAIVIDNEKNLQNELVEIDENLCRAELTASQRTKYTKRRAQIWEALHPAERQVGQVVPPTSLVDSLGRSKSPQQMPSFAAATAASTGQTKRTTNRALARADALGDTTLDKITGTSLDTGVEMDALAKLPEPARAELIERAVAGEKVSAKPAAAAPVHSPVQQPEKPPVSAQTSREHHSVADALRKALRGVLDDFGCLSVRDLIPIIADQDAQEEVQEIFESWNVAVFPVDILALAPNA